MPQPFTQDVVYARADVLGALGAHDAEGPFLIGRTAIALIVNLGGSDPDSPELPTRTKLRWPRKAPMRVTERDVSNWLFVNEGKDRLRFLGVGFASQYGHGVRDIHDVHFSFRPPLPRERWLELLGQRAMPNTPPYPEEEIAKLSTVSTPDECWSALKTFVARWYRVSVEPNFERHIDRVGPVQIYRLLDLAHAVPKLFQHNELVRADELKIDDGRVTFLLENQVVCYWATEPDGDDPLVWYRNNDDGEPWIEEPSRLSRFIIQAVLFEAVLGAPFGGSATAIPPATLEAIRTRLDPVGDGQWNWCGAHFYARNGALAVLMEAQGAWDLFLAAATPHALTGFVDLVKDDWDLIAF